MLLEISHCNPLQAKIHREEGYQLTLTSELVLAFKVALNLLLSTHDIFRHGSPRKHQQRHSCSSDIFRAAHKRGARGDVAVVVADEQDLVEGHLAARIAGIMAIDRDDGAWLDAELAA